MKVIKPNIIGLTDGSFSRSSSATYFDENGVLQSAGNNVPRFGYNPVTGRFIGLIVESARSNLLRNNTMVGAVAGTPGTIPTNWVMSLTGTGLTRSIVGTGTESGISYIDIRIQGTTTSTCVLQIQNETDISVPATSNTDYTYSFYFKVVSGWDNSTTSKVAWVERGDFGTSIIRTIDYPFTVDTSLALNKQRIDVTRKLTSDINITNMSTRVDITVPSGKTINTVIRIGLPQLHLGNKPVTPFISANTGVTYAADVITGTNLIYSNAVESTAAWSSATTYTIGQKVRYLNQIWESLQNSNLNKQPDANPTFWLNLGYDNIHAAFDQSVTTPASATTNLTFTVKTTYSDALSLINITSDIIEIAISDAATNDNIYSNSFGLSGGVVLDWYQYFFFDPLERRTQLALTGLPGTYANVYITIRLKGAVGSTVSLGNFIAGLTTDLGTTQFNPTFSITDYSKKETDEFGNAKLVPRAYSKKISADVWIENTKLNSNIRLLSSIRATPVVWVGSEDPTFEEALIVYGYYKDFSVLISYPQVSVCSLEIEGLT